VSKGHSYWDARYAEKGFAYGELPNDFLMAAISDNPLRPVRGRAISLCEGEGRNAVFLAQQGFQVTAVDFSEVGLQKAQSLARRHGVQIDCIVLDMADLDLGTDKWDLVIAIFCQPESSVRQPLYGQLGQALRQNGRFILETKVEIGATSADRYPGIELLRKELSPLKMVFAEESERTLNEGPYHQGLHRTAQIQALKS